MNRAFVHILRVSRRRTSGRSVLTQARNQYAKALRRNPAATFRTEHIGAGLLLALKAT
jgi:hypothetical protein